ncbi:zinc finger, GRF-type domain containing protein [Rhodotorula toruloides]|uniref:BY PROTMAP: gi/472580861/gb/EMS18628.1/ zinc finger, GRF-type domain containing protein [Rhodosporidium toruloides NP11] gi/647403493/emb/CDR49607.1/ RHTO0S28e01552g1_1 [Rhodosporidium toruloides] n=1 Tax=Rhodotorula toruloides TaxID=5286 RepID=A0A0K3CD30_RHOTO|nr:zinc finger, GRF-type domain containing protein [Rhodotorula toruloides]PRQ74962.1 hypothetical protein AAT19DRAFT_13984 [Rhodotorula toruloides]
MPTERRAHKTLTGKSPTKRENRYKKFKCFEPDGTIYCFCDQHPRLEARLRTCQTNKNGNQGREFWSCANPLEYCDFFIWADELDKFGHPGWPEWSPSDEEDGGGECDDVAFDRRGHRLGDGYITPPPSTQNSPVAGPSTPRKNKKRRVEREPSPDWPDVEAVRAELDEKKKEVRELRKERDEWRKEKDEMKKAIDGLKTENSRLLAKVYPEVFGDRIAAA